MKIKLFIFLILNLFCILCIGQELRLQDVRPTMEELFSYHVENRQLSPLIVRRAFKIYLEQFDPSHLYLLKSEVKPFIELTDRQVEEIIQRLKKEDYSDFTALNHVIFNATHRAESIRRRAQANLIEEGLLKNSKNLGRYLDYASTVNELEKRVYLEQVAWIEHEQAKLPKLALSKENRQKIFQLWENKKRAFENTYAPAHPNAQEHYLAMHILKAFAKSLDAHTAYYSPQEAYEIRTSLKKQMEGIGVIVKESIEGVFIADMIPGGPAARSGVIQTGDMIVAIDGKQMQDASFESIAEAMKGKAGSKVSLTLRRNQRDKPNKIVEVKLSREKIIMQQERLSYTFEPFADGIIGKITLPSFYDNGEGVTAEKDLKEAIRHLKKEGKLVGIVIDLRENSGGFLTQAVNIAGMFIKKGIIVISKYADGEIRYARDIDGKVFYDGPVILLTSKASASASEIVAQALQDYGAAIVVGDRRTYGKGSMQYQTITDDRAKAFYKVTVGRYYTASGRSTQIEGVQADIHIPTKYSFYNIGEKYLEYPLSSDSLEFALFEKLKDIDQSTYRIFKEEFLPYLPSKESKWQAMVPELKKNSRHRLERDPNFQYFLTGKNPQEQVNALLKTQKIQSNYGKEDLQMKESVNILKDMIILHQPRQQTAIAK